MEKEENMHTANEILEETKKLRYELVTEENWELLKMNEIALNERLGNKKHILYTHEELTSTSRRWGDYYSSYGYIKFYDDETRLAENIKNIEKMKIKEELLSKLTGHQKELLNAENISSSEMIFIDDYYNDILEKFLKLDDFAKGKITEKIKEFVFFDERWDAVNNLADKFEAFGDIQDRKKINEFSPIHFSKCQLAEIILSDSNNKTISLLRDSINCYKTLNKKYKTKSLAKCKKLQIKKEDKFHLFAKQLHDIIVHEYNLQTKSIIRAEKKLQMNLQNKNYLKQFQNKEPDLVFNGQKFYFKQLKTKLDLKIEGLQMDHCVGSYDPQKSDIYSIIQINEKKGGVTRGTCQIKNGKIVQLKGVKNRELSENFTQAVNQVLL